MSPMRGLPSPKKTCPTRSLGKRKCKLPLTLTLTLTLSRTLTLTLTLALYAGWLRVYAAGRIVHGSAWPGCVCLDSS